MRLLLSTLTFFTFILNATKIAAKESIGRAKFDCSLSFHDSCGDSFPSCGLNLKSKKKSKLPKSIFNGRDAITKLVNSHYNSERVLNQAIGLLEQAGETSLRCQLKGRYFDVPTKCMQDIGQFYRGRIQEVSPEVDLRDAAIRAGFPDVRLFKLKMQDLERYACAAMSSKHYSTLQRTYMKAAKPKKRRGNKKGKGKRNKKTTRLASSK